MVINLSCHLATNDEPFIIWPSRTQHGIWMAVICDKMHFIIQTLQKWRGNPSTVLPSVGSL